MGGTVVTNAAAGKSNVEALVDVVGRTFLWVDNWLWR
jgi:hypothetical protein